MQSLDDQVPRDQFREAMSHLAAAVNVITTDGPAGSAGFTASAVCSVSDRPQMLLVCLNRDASVYEAFKQNQRLCVNVLQGGQKGLAEVFGGKTPNTERFGAASWIKLATGAPVLADALVAFDCEVSQVCAAGTHDILVCAVKALHWGSDRARTGLVYFSRAFHQLPSASHP